MDNTDIRQNILLFIDDIEIFSRLCTVDKLFYEILSNKLFWDLKYNNNNLPISKILYDNPIQWFASYQKERQLKIYTNRLMEILEHPKFEDFRNVSEIYEDDFWLCSNLDDVYLPNVLNIDGANYTFMNELITIYNLHAIARLNKRSSHGRCDFYFENGEYCIKLCYYGNYLYKNTIYYVQDISRNDMCNIFYNMLSCGIVPRDGYNEHFIKL
jgi:hypothetical protein